MIKNTIIFLFSLLFSIAGSAQGSGKIPPAKSGVNTAVSDTVDVLFATNADCDLYINEEAKGSVSKNSFRFVRLTPGDYRYKAKSKTTGDELNDAFSVLKDGTNEVFMDLLYVVDEKVNERTKALNASLLADTLAQKNKGRASGKAEGKRILTKEEAQKETLTFLVSNALFMQGGSFTMGNNRAPATDETEHQVSLSPFYLSRFEVTQHQWESVMGYNPSINKGCETCPVENVSWEEAMQFVRKLNSLSNRQFRLPTEAEWEYVARAGGRAEIERAGGQEAYIKKTAWYFSNAIGRPHPVGRKEPNEAGIYDMSGNVSEWCLDWYSPTFYKQGASHQNPQGPASGREKVIRGGNFKDYTGDRFRPSFRNKKLPIAKSNEIGFRVVLDVID